MSEENREHIRLKMDSKVYVELTAAGPGADGDSELVLCDVVDVSFGGLKVNIDQEVITGSILSICVVLPTFDKPFYMAGEVVWSKENKDQSKGKWAAGFKLLYSSDSDIEYWRELLDHV